MPIFLHLPAEMVVICNDVDIEAAIVIELDRSGSTVFVILTKCNHISCSSLLVNYRDYNYYDTCQTELQKKREINW